MLTSVFLIAGELSADRYGAALLTALRERIPGLRAEALGGPRLAEAGATLAHDTSEWGAIGVAEALRRAPGVLLAQSALKRRLKRHPPDLLLPLDFGAFNVPTARYARRHGIPVCYLIPPGSWRPDGGRVSPRLAECADVFLTPFQPSERRLREARLEAYWMGHPLLDFAPLAADRAALSARLGLPSTGPVIGLLPGSRVQELRHLWPAMLHAAIRLKEEGVNAAFVTPLARGLAGDRVLAPMLRAMGWADGPPAADGQSVTYSGPVPVTLTNARALDTLAVADAAMICSGTATLEAAIVGCPMVIGYRGGGASSLEYLLRKAVVPEHIGLPNLLLRRRLCPELLQEACSPERLASEITSLLAPSPARAAQLAGFTELRGHLGERGVIGRWADFIVSRWHTAASAPPASAEGRSPAGGRP